MTCLPDVNVWLALAVDGYPHHRLASEWFNRLDAERALFCRKTEMGLLLLLTNAVVMSGAPLDSMGAWKVVDALAGDPRVGFLIEPAAFKKHWRSTSLMGRIGQTFGQTRT